MDRKVIHWDLTVNFRTKGQRDKFVKWLVSQDVQYDFESSKCDERDEYHVTIIDMCWGNNLKNVAKFLEKIDF